MCVKCLARCLPSEAFNKTAAVIVAVVPVNGPLIVDHIAELNYGFCLAEQGIHCTPIHPGPGTSHSFPGYCDERGTNMKRRSVWFLPKSSPAWLIH